MAQNYHLTLKDYIRRAYPFSVPRQGKEDQLSRLDRLNRFERVLSSSRDQYAGKSGNRPRGMTIADYMDHPVRVRLFTGNLKSAEAKTGGGDDGNQPVTGETPVPGLTDAATDSRGPAMVDPGGPGASIGDPAEKASAAEVELLAGSQQNGNPRETADAGPLPGANMGQNLPESTAVAKGPAANPAGGELLLTERQKIDRSVQKAAERYDLPMELINGVIRAESAFKPRAVSSAGAQGLMQLMPGTADELGVKDPFDIDENINAGSKYLRKMLDLFGGNVKKALMAYNAGPGTVKRYQGDVPYRETKHYIQRVLEFSGMTTRA